MWAGVLNAGCFQRIEFQEQEQMLPVPTKSTQRRFLPNKIKKLKILITTLTAMLSKNTLSSKSTTQKNYLL